LAALLIELSEEYPKLKRRLSYELAGESGAKAVAAEIGKDLLALQKAKRFLDSQKRRALVKQIDLLRSTILEKVAGERPDLALDLLWRFMALAGPTYERVDDSNGDVGDVFRQACKDLGTVAVQGSPDAISLAERVFAAISDNAYGEYDHLIEAVFPALAGPGAFHLKQLLNRNLKHPARKDPRGYHAGALKRALQEIADAEDDVDAYIDQTGEAERRRPDVAASIAQRLLADGRKSEALEILATAVHPQQTLWADDPEAELIFGREEPGPGDWSVVWVQALLANDRWSEAQAFRWTRFERLLEASSLRAYLEALPERERAEAEQKACNLVAGYPHFMTALVFLIHWPDHARAARLVLDRRAELDGNLYFLLDPSAKALQAAHPQAATLIYRAMIEDTLQGAKATRYAHAARHLFECQSLVARIEEGGNIEPHRAFVERIKAGHARKIGFWSRVAELGALPG
jgi:hypothetical protein